MSNDVTTRIVDPRSEDETRDETRRIAAFLTALYAEVGVTAEAATPNPGKAVQGVYDTIRDGVVLVAERDGQIVGSLGLVEYPIWYADATALGDKWFFVSPSERGGDVLEALLAATADVATELAKPCFLSVWNPNSQRAPRTRLERVGAALSFNPRGALYRIAPRDDEA